MASNTVGFHKEELKKIDVQGTGLSVMYFDDTAQPRFIERKGLPYVLYGEKNDYPNYLLYLYNNSAKHSAIINGKVDYVVGKGWDYEKEGVADDQQKILDSFISSANMKGESLKAVFAKMQLDIEIFNGAYINVVWTALGQIASIYHIDYTKVRSNADNSVFYVSDEWVKYNKDGSWRQIYNPDYIQFNAYNEADKIGSQILYVKQYHPGIDIYTLPGYRGSLTWIEIDVEIGMYHLSNVKSGFFANKMVNFNNGNPTQEAQEAIEKMFARKFTGTKGQRYILTFNTDATKAPTINDLNISESDKIFDQLNKTAQQEIFTGHRITSPILFGIKTEGQLGGRAEIRDSYEIFQNTYVNGRQQWNEEVANMLARNRGATTPISIVRTEPISFEFSEATQAQNMSKDEIREKMGLAPAEAKEDQSAQDIINAISNLPISLQNAVIAQMSPAQLLSLVGITATIQPAATTQLPVAQEHQFSIDNDERDAEIFAEFGTARSAHFIIRSKKVLFTCDKDEQLHFADVSSQLTDLQSSVLSMLEKDPLITQQVIADTLYTDIDSVSAAITALKEMGAITIEEKIKDGERIVERKPVADADKRIRVSGPITKSVEVKYSYEGPQDDRNRAFCAKVLQLDRLYSRKEIETISGRLGYSVWARRGGWYHNPKTNETTPYCRHTWRANVVVNQH